MKHKLSIILIFLAFTCQIKAFEFPKSLISDTLSELSFDIHHEELIVKNLKDNLLPVLEQYLIPVMLYPWTPYIKSVNPVLLEIPNPDNPNLPTKTLGTNEIVDYHLRKVISYCDNFLKAYYETEIRDFLLKKLKYELLNALAPRLEKEYSDFVKISMKHI